MLNDFPNSIEPHDQNVSINEYPERESKKSLENTQITDRGLNEYCSIFGINPQDLSGKHILDVGSGTRERFSKEASQHGATVVSMSPELRKWFKRRITKGLLLTDKRWQKSSVAGRAEEMPFRNNLFDYIFASWSIPYYSPDEEDAQNSIDAMMKALKPGGILGIFPYEKDILSNLNELISSAGCIITKNENELLMIRKLETPS